MTNPKYSPGELVLLSSRSLPSGPCAIIKSMRSDRGEALYRVRSTAEVFERVVQEHQIAGRARSPRATADALFAVAS